ncbi:MAG TPA: ABC-type transport auxiliary lipoprotein family protein [Candidatus Binatia bacterium]
MTTICLKPRSLWLLCCVLLCACVNLERSYPEKHYFVLEVSPKQQPSTRTVKGVLAVSDMRVSRSYEGQSFVYRLSETSYESDFYNQFLIAPAALITEEVCKALAQSQVFEHVFNSSTDWEPAYRLQGAVNSLYGDFTDIQAPRAVIEMQFFLTKKTPTGEEIVMAKRYTKSVPVSARSPDALVKGWDTALEDILSSFITDLKSANLQPQG